MDKSKGREGKSILEGAIEKCNEINNQEKRVLRGIASHRNGVVTSEQANTQSVGHNLTSEQSSQENKTMAFKGFDFAKAAEQFPSKAPGRGGKPSVAISDKGRIILSADVSKIMEGCTVCLPSCDETKLKIRFDGYAETPKGKEASVLPLVRPKPDANGKVKSKNVNINGTLLMKLLGYDYVKAGAQTYEVEKMDGDKHSVIFNLPATLPSPKPKAERKKREKKAPPVVAATAATAANGAIAPPPPATSDDVDVVVE